MLQNDAVFTDLGLGGLEEALWHVVAAKVR